MSLDIGSRILIEGDHPHAGKVGVIEGAYAFKHGMGNAVKINFDDGDGCFVFASDRGKVTLRELGQNMHKTNTTKNAPKSSLSGWPITHFRATFWPR